MKDITVGIFPHYLRQEARVKARKLFEILHTENVRVIMRQEEDRENSTDEELVRNSNILVSIGGDGTFLRAFEALIKYNSEAFLIGLNTSGSLGFLNYSNDLEAIKKQINNYLKGKFSFAEIKTLRIELNAGEVKYQSDFLNEAFLVRDHFSRMPMITIKVGKAVLGSFHGEGIILSSAVGSTALALSSGGPLISQTIFCVNLVPYSAHSLNLRPVMIHPAEKPKVYVPLMEDLKLHLFVDGVKQVTMNSPVYLTITEGRSKIKLLGVDNSKFYKNIQQKLSWGWKKSASGT